MSPKSPTDQITPDNHQLIHLCVAGVELAKLIQLKRDNSPELANIFFGEFKHSLPNHCGGGSIASDKESFGTTILNRVLSGNGI